MYQGVYGFSDGMMGVAFVAMPLACIFGALIFACTQWFIYEPSLLKHGMGVPESRLVPGFFASAAAPIGIFLFAWTARSSIHWIVPTIGVVIYAAAQFNVGLPGKVASDNAPDCSSSNTVLQLGCTLFIYLPVSYPRYAASLFAANNEFPAPDTCQIRER